VNAYLEKYGPIRPKVSKEIAYNDGIPAPPSLEIVPMMSADSMDAFLRRFAVVQSLQIRLAETNNEPDNTDFIMQLRESHRKTGSRTTTVNYRNAKGLKITEVQEELSSVADGHGHATVTGKDRAGRNLKGDNEHFGVQVQIDPIPEKVSAAIDQIMGEFDALIDSGTVDPGTVEADTKRKVNKAFNEYR
jgi:hypothetical protein